MYRFIVDRFSEITNSINCTMSEQSVIRYLAFNLYIHVPWYLTLTFICSCIFYYFIMYMECFTRYYIHVHVHIEISLITHDNHKVGRHDRK